MIPYKKEIEGQIFWGKEDLLLVLANGVNSVKERVESAQDVFDGYGRFLETLKGSSPHCDYMRLAANKLRENLLKNLNGNCIKIDFYCNPNLVYGVYIRQSDNKVLIAIKGYDVRRMPIEEFNKIWGR